VKIFDINVDKKKTIARTISNFKKVFIIDQIISLSITIHCNKSIVKNTIDSNKTIRKIINENHKIFPKINSYLLIGLDKIKKIVFQSTSLKSNWLQTNNTQSNQKISIIDKPKSTIILLFCHIVNFHRSIEKIIKTKEKNTIIYKYLFLIISLKVFNAMFNIKNKG
jgi:hypothetical protein